MKMILVPTDFSKASKNAAEYAVYLAKKIHAQVRLIHVYHIPVVVSEVPMILISPETLKSDKEKLLKKEAARLLKKTGVKVHTTSILGEVVPEILKIEGRFFMLVMGMKGEGKWAEKIMGSTTTEIIRKSLVPVMVVPEKAKYKTPQKILLASDYLPMQDEHTLEILKKISKHLGADVDVLHIEKEKGAVLADEAIEAIELERKLSKVKHHFYFHENDNIAEGIQDYVMKFHYDVVAVTPHRHTILERLFFHKSITRTLAFHTHVPLLTLPENHKNMAAFFI